MGREARTWPHGSVPDFNDPQNPQKLCQHTTASTVGWPRTRKRSDSFSDWFIVIIIAQRGKAVLKQGDLLRTARRFTETIDLERHLHRTYALLSLWCASRVHVAPSCGGSAASHMRSCSRKTLALRTCRPAPLSCRHRLRGARWRRKSQVFHDAVRQQSTVLGAVHDH